jgi:hypothetical protein
MALPDMTPGINMPMDLFGEPPAAASGCFALSQLPKAAAARTARTRTFFIGPSNGNSAGAKKSPGLKSRVFAWEIRAGKAHSDGAHTNSGSRFSSIRTIPSAPEFHRFDPELFIPGFAGYNRRLGISAFANHPTLKIYI